jgi:hypothetical protein
MSELDDEVLQAATESGEQLSRTKPKGPKQPKPREPRVKSGINELLEAEADALIFGSLKDVTSREAKSDILTPWKEKNRKSREILSRSGHPIDGSLRRGMFHRAYNPVQTHLNSYDGPTRPIKMDARWEDENGESYNFPVSPGMQQIFGIERDD